LLPILGLYANKKKQRKEKKRENKKNKNIYISEKSIPECPGNHRKLVEEDQIYKIKKYDKVFSTDECPIDKGNLI